MNRKPKTTVRLIEKQEWHYVRKIETETVDHMNKPTKRSANLSKYCKSALPNIDSACVTDKMTPSGVRTVQYV